MADRLELEARFNDHASAGVKRLGKTLDSVKPSNGMQAASKWMGEFRSAADKANVAVRPITSSLTALGVGGLAAGLSLGEIVRQMRDLADSTLTMRELGRQSRMSATEISRLQYAAGKLHVDPAAVGGAISSWSSKMLEFRMHTSEFYRYLMRQNADVAAKIQSDNPVDALKDSLDYLSRIKDPQIQKRVADMAGLGDLTPMLGKGPQGLAEAFADAAREVKPISQSLIEAADKLNNSTNRMSQSWTNLKNDIGPAVLDPMSKMIDKLDETLKFAAAHPGDAAAVAGVGVGSAAAIYARYRIMRGSKLGGGGPGLDRAAGELTGAAGALKQAAAALEGKGVGGPGGPGAMPSEDGKPSSGSFNSVRGILAAFGLGGVVLNAPGMDEAGDRERDANASALESFGELAKKWTGADWLEGKVNEWRKGGAPGQDLKKDVQDGSKAGIIAGLKELAQQQELDGKGSPGINADGGVPNMRRGRGGNGKWRSTPGTEGGAPLGQGAVGGSFKGGRSAQAGVAKESYDFYRAKGLDHNAALSMVAQEQGESGFNYRQKSGDSGLAHGAYSWHPDRRAAILAQTGINIDNATHLQQLEAAWHEGTKGSRAGFFQSLNGRSLQDAIYQGVHRFEGSKYQMADTAKRLGMARAWDGGGSFLAPKPPAVPAAGHASGGWISGPGGPTADRIPAMLSNGEFVVQAKAAGQFLPLLHAINNGGLSRFANGGRAGRGSGITPDGRGRIESWMNFFMRPDGEGGMGASRRTALGAVAMMQGESGRNLDPRIYQPNDVDGPSGGSAQWHDVTKGRLAGKLRRFSDLMDFATAQHADWKDMSVQQAFWKKEARSGMRWAWDPMRRARTAPGTLKQGIDKFENPAHHDLEMRRRLPNIAAMVREHVAGLTPQNAGPVGPLEVNIHHHPHTGRPMVRASAGEGIRLKIRTAPTMQPT